MSAKATAADKHDALADCTVCAAGKYSAVKQTTDCIDCPEGTYNAKDASKAANHDKLDDCTNCAAGKYSAATKQTRDTCISCAIGKYGKAAGTGGNGANADAEADRTICAAGTYVATAAQTVCIDCPKRTCLVDKAAAADKHDALADCTNCAAAKYSAVSKQTSDTCISCAVGKFGKPAGTKGDDVVQHLRERLHHQRRQRVRKSSGCCQLRKAERCP